MIDYRGFADSTGQPSEAGLLSDARSAFDWLVAHGKRAEDILIVGHSLGTGVSGLLGAELSSEGINCRGIVLLSVGGKVILMRSLVDDNSTHSPSQAYERYYLITTCLASFP